MASGTRWSLMNLPQWSKPRKSLAETKHFQTVYVIDEADAKRTIGQLNPRWENVVRNGSGASLYLVRHFRASALTCLVIELTARPDMTYLAVLSAGSGRRAGFAALGIALGLEIPRPRRRGCLQHGPVARLIQEFYKICRFTPARPTSVGANRPEASIRDPWTSWGLQTRQRL
jgi:hypothetical protein